MPDPARTSVGPVTGPNAAIPGGSRARAGSALLPLILCLLPLAILNLGWYGLRLRQHQAAVATTTERAEQALAALERHSAFSTHLDLAGDRLRRFLDARIAAWHRAAASSRGATPPGTVAGFTWPRHFPHTQVWVFARTPGSVRLEPLVAPRDTGFGLKAMGMIGQTLLAAMHGARPSAAGSKLVQTCFGRATPVDALACLRRGEATPVFHGHRPAWMLWDVIGPTANPEGVFVILVPQTRHLVTRGARLGRDLISARFGMACGFIRIHHTDETDALAPAMRRHVPFRRWLRDWRPHIALSPGDTWIPPDLGRIEHDWPETVTLSSRRQVRLRIIPESIYIAAVLLPYRSLPAAPLGVWLVNGIALALATLALTHAGIFGRWPRVGLRWRFAALFLLATAVPTTLVLVAGVAWSSEQTAAEMADQQQRLRTWLEGFERERAVLQFQYQMTFHRLRSKPWLLDAVGRGDYTQPGLLERMLAEFVAATPSQPLAHLALADIRGVRLATSPPPLVPRDLRGRLFRLEPPTDFLTSVRLIRTNLIRYLRQATHDAGRLAELGPSPLDQTDLALLNGYSAMSGADQANLAERNRGRPAAPVGDQERTLLIHDFVTLGGRERAALLAVWRSGDLLPHLVGRGGERATALGSNTQYFIGYEHRQTLTPLARSSVCTPELLHAARATALHGGFSAVTSGAAGRLAAALSLPRLSRLVFAVGVDIRPILAARRQRQWGLLALLATTVLSTLAAGVLLGQRVVAPVLETTAGLALLTRQPDRREHLRLGLARADEMGQLTRSFDLMIAGIARRERLATLVSGQALAAIDRQHGQERTIGPEWVRAVVLVSDIREFTTLCEHRPAEAITGLLNTHFERMSTVIAAHGGRIDRFIGEFVRHC